MHEAGVWHADLNAHNILLDTAGQPWLIDFDRARDYGEPLAHQLRVANMQRLRRSLEKVAGAQGSAFWQSLNRACAQRHCGYGNSLRSN
uniref:CAZy families GT30 protein n=1 Tax=uncultured Idiomarina sp. TaxID=352961 RepID=A0A060C1R4_9GAMM|nr:CAZy families GT30 protein [uncultured Idiomarina sp.]